MEIELRKYFKMIRKRFWILVACAVVFPLAAVMFTGNSYVPVYQSSAELMLNRTGNGRQPVDMNAIGYIMKTPAILDKVVQWYPDLHMNSAQLGNDLNITQVDNSQLMRISAVNTSYPQTVKMVNDVIQVSQSEIPKIFRGTQITVLNPAVMQTNPRPVNPNTSSKVKKILLGVLLAVVFSIGLILVMDFADDTLKTEEDIRAVFGKPSLAVVPRIKDKQLRNRIKKSSEQKVGETPYAASHR